jgi:hypothetical protein
MFFCIQNIIMKPGQIQQRFSVVFAVPLFVLFLASCAETAHRPSTPPEFTTENTAIPVQVLAPGPLPASPAENNASSITKIVVPSFKITSTATYQQSKSMPDVFLPEFEIPTTGAGGGKKPVRAPVSVNTENIGTDDPGPQSWVGTSSQFISTNFVENAIESGFYSIPPDSHAAAGPDHVVNVVNTSITFHQKNGTRDFRDSLADFFTTLTPLTNTFDPKVLYDQYEDRWVVITMERTTSPSNTSRMFVAVSDDSDPNNDWTISEFSTAITISTTDDHWSDYPGFAVDEEAVYITANLFSFAGNSFGGTRLWILDKGVSGGFYDGGTLSYSVHNPYAGGGIATTTQPSHMYGTGPTDVGVFLVSYSGISNTVQESFQVVRVDDPLGSPAFAQQFVSVGDIEDLATALPGTPQLGTTTLIQSNDRRALDAVWKDDTLYVTTTIDPNSGGADDGQATAVWYEFSTNTLSAITPQADHLIGGEDIATGTYTTFPSIAVNSIGDVVVGFSASASSIYAGAYFVTKDWYFVTISETQEVKAGVDSYVRTFGGGRNRWGDYSAAALDPADACFWVYNQWADTQGTKIRGESGQWGTAYAKTCPCEASYDIAADEWTRFALPCGGISGSTVADVFDGLNPANYDSTWVVYNRDSANQTYSKLGIGDDILLGDGYWVYSETPTQVSDRGWAAPTAEVNLVGVATVGRDNYVGHFRHYSVPWNLVSVNDGGTILSFGDFDKLVGGTYDCDAPAKPTCVMSRIMQKWNGSAYQMFDGDDISGTGGSLDPFDAFWVQAFKAGIKLQIPFVDDQPSPPPASAPLSAPLESFSSSAAITNKKPKKDKRAPWYIRLIATAGNLEDPGNVFGQLEKAKKGNDHKDLEEPAPFGNKYLSILFTNPLFEQVDWGFTTDFRGLEKEPQGVWPFVVKAHAGIEEVTIRWEGDDYLFNDAWLVDEQSGEMMKVKAGESYTFNIFDGEHHFRFELGDG